MCLVVREEDSESRGVVVCWAEEVCCEKEVAQREIPLLFQPESNLP